MIDYRAKLAEERDAPRPEKARRFLSRYVRATTSWPDLRDTIRHAAGFNGAVVRIGLDGLEDVLGGRPSDDELLALAAAGGARASTVEDARVWLRDVARLVRAELEIGPYGPAVEYDAVSTVIAADGEWVRVRCVEILDLDGQEVAVFVREGTDEVACVCTYVPGPETVGPADEDQTRRAIALWRAG